jgi:hypothetical protein
MDDIRSAGSATHLPSRVAIVMDVIEDNLAPAHVTLPVTAEGPDCAEGWFLPGVLPLGPLTNHQPRRLIRRRR